jgi:hypothetical protein
MLDLKCWVQHWMLDLKNVGSEVLDSRLKCWMYVVFEMLDLRGLDEMLDLASDIGHWRFETLDPRLDEKLDVGFEGQMKCWIRRLG